MNCPNCQHFKHGSIATTCPLWGKVSPNYKGGCDVAEAAERAKKEEAARIAFLPDIPAYEASHTKLEKALQRLCELELRRRGIEYLHLSPKAREKVGWPDLVFCVKGRPCAVELKGPQGQLSADQKRMLDAMEANGWEVAVLREFVQFKAFLDVELTEEWEGQA